MHPVSGIAEVVQNRPLRSRIHNALNSSSEASEGKASLYSILSHWGACCCGEM